MLEYLGKRQHIGLTLGKKYDKMVEHVVAYHDRSRDGYLAFEEGSSFLFGFRRGSHINYLPIKVRFERRGESWS